MNTETGISLPFLGAEKIKKAADEFRERYWKKPMPVNIEHVVEIQLGILLSPVPGLRQRFGVLAFISSNWGEIIVDKEVYEDDRFRPILNFCFAHEIGHFVLHKEAYSALRIASLEDYYKFTEAKAENGNSFHKYAEVQADIFANTLLVPSDELKLLRDVLLASKKEEMIKTGLALEKSPILNNYLAVDLAEKFQVSETVVKIALDRMDSELKSGSLC